MLFRGLKTKLAVNLVFILLFAVLLTDFVVIRIVEKSLIHKRIQQGRQFITAVEDIFGRGILDASISAVEIRRLVNTSHPWVVHGRFSFKNGNNIRFGDEPAHIAFDIQQIHQAVLKTADSRHALIGETWGVFWKQSKYAALSGPFFKESPAGAVTLIIRLDDIYAILRGSQKIIVFYSLANLFLLLFIGMFRLSRLIVRPIHRFIRLTGDLRSSDQFPAYPGRHDTEFGQLSNAIHGMAKRIEEDKERIEESLHSLEKAHAELKNTQKEMIRTEKLASIGRLSAGIAHEIGNPIGIVLGYLGLLKRQQPFEENPSSRDYIERAESEINRINTIIRQLLDFSRSSPSQQQVVFTHALIKDVGQMFSHQPLMGDIELSYDLCARHDTVYADYQHLRQVLINLLINAVDSIRAAESADGGSIRLQTADIDALDKKAINQSATIELTVADNGTGIAREEIDNIFDPFYTTKDPGKGTGLGLSVSYMIIEQFGGAIQVTSELNQGTAMSIYLLAVADE